MSAMSCFDDYDNYDDYDGDYYDVRSRKNHACMQPFFDYDSHRFHLYRIFYNTCLMCQRSKEEEIEWAWKDREDEMNGDYRRKYRL